LKSAEWHSGYVTLALMMGDQVSAAVRSEAPPLFFDEKRAVRAKALAEGLTALMIDMQAMQLRDGRS
jgi:hypothetical protein